MFFPVLHLWFLAHLCFHRFLYRRQWNFCCFQIMKTLNSVPQMIRILQKTNKKRRFLTGKFQYFLKIWQLLSQISPICAPKTYFWVAFWPFFTRKLNPEWIISSLHFWKCWWLYLTDNENTEYQYNFCYFSKIPPNIFAAFWPFSPLKLISIITSCCSPLRLFLLQRCLRKLGWYMR